MTSRFPSGRDSYPTYCLLFQYHLFILSIDDHTRLVFADEKPMKEINIFQKVRRNVVNGEISNHRMNANSKNRYNILAAVTIKIGEAKSVDLIILIVAENHD